MSRANREAPTFARASRNVGHNTERSKGSTVTPANHVQVAAWRVDRARQMLESALAELEQAIREADGA
jgi:hypothetical protein